MTTTAYKYSTSVNIKRDWDANINYIPTPNSKAVFNQILNDAVIGIHSFTIIGAYGSGKSSFLVALQKHLQGKQNYFLESKGLVSKFPTFDYIPIIGVNESISNTMAEVLGFNPKIDFRTSDLINALEKYYQSLSKKGKGLIILIDEFGKFLEYAAQNNPESELYFIQQLSEFINDSAKNILLITTLHQDFNTYSNSLSKAQKQEWDKVKGRIKEITFNEPVEQLLFLASKRIEEKYKGAFQPDKNFNKLFNSIKEAKAFPLKDYLNEDFANRLLPFDILSASILTLALQNYGQNERSLFSFLESNDPLGISDFNNKQNPYYNISCVYDYLSHNYYTHLNSRNNANFSQWQIIKKSIERAEGLIQDEQSGALKLIKTIGLLNIFGSASVRLDDNFLNDYGKYALGIKNPGHTIKELESFKIIKYIKHAFKYALFEGSDVDIELEIDRAGNLVEKVTNVVNGLNEHFEFPFIQAKQVTYSKGTPRLFQFKLSEYPIRIVPEAEVDGFINLIFNENLKEAEVKKISMECKEAILFGHYTNTKEISKLLFEIKKINKVIYDNSNDYVAVRELKSILEHQIKLLNHYVLGSFYSDKNNINWYSAGVKISLKDKLSLNKSLSALCDKVYLSTPVYKNEMVNKTKISSQISSARRELIKSVLEFSDQKELGFEAGRFPPERTIYLSLLRETGMHRSVDGIYTITSPKDESFNALWNECVRFIDSTRDNRRSLGELAEILYARPFKLKKGFIDFWLPLLLIIKKDDYALYSDEGYIPELSSDTMDLIVKDASLYYIKAFDFDGVNKDLFIRYRSILNLPQTDKISNKSFIETIKPFIVFYNKDLKDYAKNTKRFEKDAKKVIALRDAIAKSTDPEKSFFIDFPNALGYTTSSLKSNPDLADVFIKELQNVIYQLKTSYDRLLDRFENFLVVDVLGYNIEFSEYSSLLKNRYKKLKKHLLLNHQKTFFLRLSSELDDRKSWLTSIAQACIGKPLDKINDEDEKILSEKIQDMIYELDNLCDISKGDYNNENEDVIKLEMTSFVKGLTKNFVRLPKTKSKMIDSKSEEIRELLGDDKQVNIAILAKLLQEIMTK